jgi:hypothetical protein
MREKETPVPRGVARSTDLNRSQNVSKVNSSMANISNNKANNNIS